MGLFWKRKSGDQFVSLKLNEPLPEKASEKMPEETVQTAADRTSDAGPAQAPSLSRQGEAALSNVPPSASPPVIEAVPTGGGFGAEKQRGFGQNGGTGGRGAEYRRSRGAL